MSYNLAIWLGISAIGRDEAKMRYAVLCDDDGYVKAVDAIPDIARFIQDLTSEYPEFGQQSRDDCPWSAPFSIFRDAAIACLLPSYSHMLGPWVKSKARHYGLICYDPQQEMVQLPNQLYGTPIARFTPPVGGIPPGQPVPRLIMPDIPTATPAPPTQTESTPPPTPPTTIELIPGTTYFDPPTVQVAWGKQTLYDNSGIATTRKSDLVHRIVDIAGPLREEDIVLYSAAAVGIKFIDRQTTQAIGSTIELLVHSGDLESRNGFVYIAGQSAYPARIARNDSMSRPIESISQEEIAEITMAILKTSPGLTNESLTTQAAKLLGFHSVGDHFRDRIAEAISLLELDNRIDDNGSVIRTLEPA